MSKKQPVFKEKSGSFGANHKEMRGDSTLLWQRTAGPGSVHVSFYLTEKCTWFPVLSLTDGADISSLVTLTPRGCCACALRNNMETHFNTDTSAQSAFTFNSQFKDKAV